MGLKFPNDLDAWVSWQQRRRIPRTALRALARRGAARSPDPVLTAGSNNPRVLIVCDSTSPTTIASLLKPVEHLPSALVAVLAPGEASHLMPRGDWTARRVGCGELATFVGQVAVVAAAGHYLKLGAAAFALAVRHGVPFVVVQHGLLTPWAPPLPPGAQLLSWTRADADFWRSGRVDITCHVVGSQILADASKRPSAAIDPTTPPVYLGQIHGRELSRRSLVSEATRFCLRHNAPYRPHPSERDAVSRLVHAAWRRAGVRMEHSVLPISQLERPVVSVFSTGILEASASGVPAWVHHSAPPPWLRDFWSRYGMSRWGGAPTSAPALRPTEPALLVADHLASIAQA